MEQKILKHLARDSDVVGGQLALQAEMYLAEAELADQPEFFLLLCYVYGTLEEWQLVYDAAELGLAALWPDGLPEPASDAPERSMAIQTCELEVALAASRRRLALQYFDLKPLLSE